MIRTAKEPATDAEPLPAAPATVRFTFSLDCALTLMPPFAAVSCTPGRTMARVIPLNTIVPTDAPAAVEPDTAALITLITSRSSASACTVIDAPSKVPPALAVVSSFK